MTATWQTAADALTADLRRIFGDRLRSIVAYGALIEGDTHAPLTCLALVTELTVPDLEACARQASRWERQQIAVPLLLPEGEFRRSLDAFPLEYDEIIRAHARVHGDDPFDGVAIAPGDLRRACETQAKSHLTHLREGFIEAGNRPADIARLVAASAPAFGALLRHVAWLHGEPSIDRQVAAHAGARAAGLPEAVVRDVLALADGSGVPAGDPARLLPAYLAAVEQLARTVDAWRP